MLKGDARKHPLQLSNLGQKKADKYSYVVAISNLACGEAIVARSLM